MENSKHIANRTDDSLRVAVEESLQAAMPHAAALVGVATERGTITLSGELHSEDERVAAVHAVAAVIGVRAIADELSVRGPHWSGTTDTDIAAAAAAALGRAEDVPHDVIVVEVTDRIVVLSGTVTSAPERLAAERAIGYVRGIERIDNRLGVSRLP